MSDLFSQIWGAIIPLIVGFIVALFFGIPAA